MVPGAENAIKSNGESDISLDAVVKMVLHACISLKDGLPEVNIK